MRKKYLHIFIWLFILIGCYDDYDHSTKIEYVREPKIFVRGNILGTVHHDESQNVSVIINGEEIKTIGNLIPPTQLSQLSKKGQFIEIMHNDEIIGASHVAIKENDFNYLNLNTLNAPFQYSPSDPINIDNNLSLDFSSTEFTHDGKPVSGTPVLKVLVADTAQASELISYAYSISGNIQVVSPFIGFRIGVYDSAHQKLELSNSFDLEQFYDDVISLYHFDEDIQEWVEVLNENNSNFSLTEPGWYVLGEGTGGAFLEKKVMIENVPLSYNQFAINFDNWKRTFNSSANGSVSGFIPAEENGVISALNPCGKVVAEQAIEQLDSVFEIPTQNATYFTHNFKTFNCNKKILDFNYFKLFSGMEEQIMVFPSSLISNVLTCAKNIEIAAIESSNLKEVNSLQWNVDLGSPEYMSSCEDQNNTFGVFSIRNEQKIFDEFFLEFKDSKMVFFSKDSIIKFIIDDKGKGTYESNQINIKIDDSTFGENGYFISCERSEAGCGIEKGILTHDSRNGDEITRFSFKGKLWMQTKDPPQAGNFKVEGVISIKNG